ncbi:hypothetical protein BDA96_06G097300 [Sorghum bicolor]|uniref:Ig-like domain-containing protein n=1 Tax=Sorghum bicolor TaxID=4558 RepID=A0A921UCV6_SORBI|nr:hypothetical protein BDA96_06G097300 [Sorghum bicolor]
MPLLVPLFTCFPLLLLLSSVSTTGQVISITLSKESSPKSGCLSSSASLSPDWISLWAKQQGPSNLEILINHLVLRYFIFFCRCMFMGLKVCRKAKAQLILSWFMGF